MNRRTFLSTALILILLALISCFNNATNPEEKKSAIIHFDFEFGDSSSEADRDSIEQLLVIVTSNELSDTIRGEFNYAESKGSFDEDIPVGIPLTISVSAYTFYGEMIFSGRTTIEKSAPKTTVTLNLQKKPPTAPADLVLPQHTLGDSVKLRWSDRSTIEHGYVIMRSVANDHQFQVIDTVEQDRQVFIDTTALENAVVYEYRVYAFNHAGLSESYVEGEVRFGNWPPAFEPGRPYSIYESSGTGDTVSIAVRATDKETELVAIRYEIDTTLFPRAQTIVFEANTFTWVSQPGDSGEFPITFIASDGYVETETMVTLSVTLANLPPIISIPQYQSGDIVSVKEGRKLQLQFSLDDPNEGQQPSFTDLKNPPWSDVNGSGSFDTLAGLFTFTPSFSAVKESDSVILDTVTLFASDNHSSEEISSFRFLLQVIDSNSAPRWVENEYAASAQERQLVSVDLKDLFDSDPEGDLVQFSSDKGSVEDTVWKYVPSYDDAGEMTVRITAEDSHTPPASSELVLTVTVADSNRAPFFVTDMPEATYLLEGDGDQLSIPVVAEDADSHDQVSVSYTVDESQFPRPNAITFSDGTFEWTSQVGDKGSFTILFLATDGKDSTVKEITLSIAGANLPPEVAIKGETQRAFSVQEGKTLTLQMIASDKNEDQAVDFIAVHNAPWADADNGEGSFDVETGIFSFTPSFTVSNRVEQGSFTNIEIVAEDSDDSPLQGTLSFEIQVVDSNRAPVNHDISLDVNENNSLSIQLQAEDADGDELLYEIIDNPSHGTASVSTLDPSIYQYLPDENFSGTDSFTCIVSDGDKVSTKATVTITVKSVNNAPRFVDPMVSSVEMDENGNRTIMFSVTDPDNTTPDVTIPLIPDWATLSNAEDTWTLRLNPTYDIASNASPTYETDLIIRILDEEDTEVFTSHTLHVSINNVNHAPTLSSSPEDARAEIGTIYTMRLAIIDEDVDGDPVEVMLTKKPDGMSVDNTTGDITWSVDRENYRAGSIETVTARVSDGYAYTDYSWDIELLPHTWQLRSEYTLEISDYPSSDKIVARDSNELYLFSQMEKIVQYSNDG
ncbi:MAG: Ig-like domain-containing protein, partial [Chitinivibrionales bacterium]